MSDPTLDQPPVEQPPPEKVDQTQPPPDEFVDKLSAAADSDDDTTFDQVLEDNSVPLPDGSDRLGPISAVKALRGKLKSAKTAHKETASKVAELEQHIAQLTPLAQAYDAARQAQQQQPPPKAEPAAPSAEDVAELQEIARDFDFYKADGTPDLERAKRHQEREDKRAARIAAQHVAPIAHNETQRQSIAMLQRAMVTVGKDGAKPTEDNLRLVWNQLDPSVTATPQGAAQAWAVAVGYTYALGQGTAAAPKADEVPPPLHVERAGGRDADLPTLTDADKRAARDLGMTDKDYAAELKGMPKDWGKMR